LNGFRKRELRSAFGFGRRFAEIIARAEEEMHFVGFW
jgi:hypothetical protein